MAMPSAWCWPHMPGQCYCYSALKPLLVGVKPEREHSAVALRQQAGVSANGRGIYGSGSFGYEAQQVMRTAGLGAGAGQAHPAKGLHTHHGTDHITVNIDISHPDPAFDVSSKALISALDAEGQTKTAAVDAVDDLVQICGAVAGDVQNRPEMFLVELADTLQPERCGGDELASLAELLRNRSLCQQALHLTVVLYVLQELLAGCLINYRANVRGQIPRITHLQLLHGSEQESFHLLRYVLLQEQNPQCRATLPGTGEGRLHYVSDHLLRQGSGVDYHGVLPSGFSDQGCQGCPLALSQTKVDLPGRGR